MSRQDLIDFYTKRIFGSGEFRIQVFLTQFALEIESLNQNQEVSTTSHTTNLGSDECLHPFNSVIMCQGDVNCTLCAKTIYKSD